jgi:DNA-binding response OmpR family regulator
MALAETSLESGLSNPNASSQQDEVQVAFDLFERLPPQSNCAERYRAVVVEGDDQVRNMLVECLRFCNFEAEGFADSAVVLREIFPDVRSMTWPDLFIIDLELKPAGIDGMKLIEWLSDNNVPSAIMATSANVSNSYLVEAMKIGAEDIVSKPLDVFRVIKRMEKLASIGRNRRLYRQCQFSSNTADPSRQHRPVFLSYSERDRRMASVIRSHIEAAGVGVWYAPDNLQPGDVFRKRIVDAIDGAHVFVPLITDNYPNSAFCMAELLRFYRRLTSDNPPLLLPVLCGLPDTIPNFEWIKPIVDEHQYADITSERILNGLTALVGVIQKAVTQHLRL